MCPHSKIFFLRFFLTNILNLVTVGLVFALMLILRSLVVVSVLTFLTHFTQCKGGLIMRDDCADVTDEPAET